MKQNNIPIIIPSYKRSKLLESKTLTLLQECKISPKNIYVVLANQNEKKIYQDILDPKKYGHIIIACKGLHKARNFINKRFPNGTKLIFMDDDIEFLNQLTYQDKDDQAKNKWERTNNLKMIISRGFTACDKHNCRLWGLYPVFNKFYMKKNMMVGWPFVCGPLYGIINDHKLTLTLEELEDYQRTLQYCKADGNVIRFNDVTYKTQFHAPGGMLAHNEDRVKNSHKNVKKLKQIYPDIVVGDKLKPNGSLNPVLKPKKGRLFVKMDNFKSKI